MHTEAFHSFCLAILMIWAAQSLADIAAEEAERRRRVDGEGRAEKVIDGDPGQWAPNGNMTRWTAPALTAAPDPSPARGGEAKSLRQYRNALRKLDQAIRKEERQLALKRERLEVGRYALPGPGPLDPRAGSRKADARARLQADVAEIEARLAELRLERAETYDEGRKAGFLPGELDGKGIR